MACLEGLSPTKMEKEEGAENFPDLSKAKTQCSKKHNFLDTVKLSS